MDYTLDELHVGKRDTHTHQGRTCKLYTEKLGLDSKQGFLHCEEKLLITCIRTSLWTSTQRNRETTAEQNQVFWSGDSVCLLPLILHFSLENYSSSLQLHRKSSETTVGSGIQWLSITLQRWYPWYVSLLYNYRFLLRLFCHYVIHTFPLKLCKERPGNVAANQYSAQYSWTTHSEAYEGNLIVPAVTFKKPHVLSGRPADNS